MAQYLEAVATMLSVGKPFKSDTLQTDGRVVHSYPANHGGMLIARWMAKHEMDLLRENGLMTIFPTTTRILSVEHAHDGLLKTIKRHIVFLATFFNHKGNTQVHRVDLGELEKGLKMSAAVQSQRGSKPPEA